MQGRGPYLCVAEAFGFPFAVVQVLSVIAVTYVIRLNRTWFATFLDSLDVFVVFRIPSSILFAPPMTPTIGFTGSPMRPFPKPLKNPLTPPLLAPLTGFVTMPVSPSKVPVCVGVGVGL